jgi:hypothetical protein
VWITEASPETIRKQTSETRNTVEERRRLLLHLDAVLEAVELPARVADLDAGLADVDRDALPHPLRFLVPRTRLRISRRGRGAGGLGGWDRDRASKRVGGFGCRRL